MTQSVVEMPKAEVFENALCGELGEAKARDVVQEAVRRHGQLYAARKQYADGALRQHLEGSILPGVAIYQTLLADPDTQERALELVEVIFRQQGALARQAMGRWARLPFFYWVMRVMVKPMMRRSFPEQGWETEWLEVSGKEISFNMNRCFYWDVLQEYGVPELAAYYCWMDDLIYEDLSPYFKWVRTGTLARGDACCDFRFVRARRK